MLITLNEDKCISCGLCVHECVSGVLRMKDGRPYLVTPDLCNRCSHCMAVCPNEAIHHECLDASQTVKVNRKNLDASVYRDIVLSRRSVRAYKDKPVSRDIINQILDTARYAPTASNQQDVGYIVVTDKKLIQDTSRRIFNVVYSLHERLSRGIPGQIMKVTGLARNRYLRIMDYIKDEDPEDRDFILYNAPVLILMHMPEKSRFASEDCAIAATTIISYAHSLGLGTCIIGFLTMAMRFMGSLRKQLGVPKGRAVYTSLVMGYPAYGFARTVTRKNPEIIWKS